MWKVTLPGRPRAAALLVPVVVWACAKPPAQPIDAAARAAAEWAATTEVLRIAVEHSWAGKMLRLACVDGFSQAVLPAESLVVLDTPLQVTKDLQQCQRDSSSFLFSASGHKPAVLVVLKSTKRGDQAGVAVVAGEWFESGTSAEDFICTVPVTPSKAKASCEITGTA